MLYEVFEHVQLRAATEPVYVNNYEAHCSFADCMAFAAKYFEHDITANICTLLLD